MRWSIRWRLHSSYSSVRLESFLFTEQAFRDVKAKLKPGGVFAMYNFYRQGWVVGRLVKLAETVFGSTADRRLAAVSRRHFAERQSARLHHVPSGRRRRRRRSSSRSGRSSRPSGSSGSTRSRGSMRASNGFGPVPPIVPPAPGHRRS